MAVSLLPFAAGEEKSQDELAYEVGATLSQCAGINADNYCCGMGNGGGWGWLPAMPMEYTWPAGGRGFLYAIALIWTFFGVAILSDAFMAGIETITGQTKIVVTKDEHGNYVCNI